METKNIFHFADKIIFLIFPPLVYSSTKFVPINIACSGKAFQEEIEIKTTK
jgi:hypothetical protein